MIDRHDRDIEKNGGGDRSTPIKVDPLRLEAMLDLIGEMVVIKSQLAHNPLIAASGDSALAAIISHFDRTVRELQERTLSLRLSALKPLFLKIQRAVRDLALKQGKSVDFEFDGGDTEIDRGLIEAITDPLLHIARNAIDHGMETASERASAGKKEPGRISLTARTLGDRVVIELRDNGRGIDRARVIEKARERGLIAGDAGPELTDRDVFALLFEAGFSTAEKVTEVSGRGVGLDVVRAQLEKIRGHVDVVSTFGEGTCFRLSLPLTTAITEGMLAKFGGVKFILPLSGVREIVRTSEYKITRIDSGASVIGLRGRFLPIVDLRSVLSFTGHETRSSRPIENTTAIIAEHSGGLSALIVDEVVGQIQVVVKALSEKLQKSEGLSGGAILGDGTVALVLDMDGIAREYHRWMDSARPRSA
jgi:two-component system chemotaxis sensor kinase CheA